MSCSVDECNGDVYGWGWCSRHYRRWKRHGDVTVDLRSGRDTCSVDGCERLHWARGFCSAHLQRWRRTGTAGDAEVQAKGVKDNAYFTAHARVRRLRGSASTHVCRHCGDGAQDWAYDHGDASATSDSEGRVFSDNADHYLPLCLPCHRAFDKESSRRTV